MDSREIYIAVQVKDLQNGSFIGQILDKNVTNFHSQGKPYDHSGAVYYILAVLFMYSFSILMMIGSFARKSKQDSSIGTYMKDLEKVSRLKMKQEKFKTKLKMQKKKVHRMLGPDRAEIVDESVSVKSLSPSSVCGEDVFTWGDGEEDGGEERRPSNSSISTIIVSAREIEVQMMKTWTGILRSKSSDNVPATSRSDSVKEDQGKTERNCAIPEVRIHVCD